MRIPTLPIEHSALLKMLLWATLAVGALVVALILTSALIQAWSDRINRRRIACFKAWEEALPEYLYQMKPLEEAFGTISARDLAFFRAFLLRYRSTLGGEDRRRLRALYHGLGLDAGLPLRLRHSKAVVRAQAALEVETYDCRDLLGPVAGLLEDGKPFVAFSAARTLARLQSSAHMPGVFAWALRQEDYQQDRILELLEDFGPELLRWIESTTPAENDAAIWRFYALLAAGLRDDMALPTLIRLLGRPGIEVQAAALRALGALGDLSVWEHIRPFFAAEAPPLRLHAARAAGNLGQLLAMDELVAILEDPVYEVRREAGIALTSLGNPGLEVLRWVAADLNADRFARDMAMERLEWGRP